MIIVRPTKYQALPNTNHSTKNHFPRLHKKGLEYITLEEEFRIFNGFSAIFSSAKTFAIDQ